MKFRLKSPLVSILCGVLLLCGCWNQLSPAERQIADSILAHWENWVPARQQDGSAPLLTFAELYRGLNAEQTAFLDRLRAIKPSNLDYDPKLSFVKIAGQKIKSNGQESVIPPQYLPQRVYDAYEVMMQAMEKDLGRRLYIESGYRSPAYQLYTFLYYCPKHNYSLKETRRWVALPGRSEHGDPSRQAIDFINEEGINGDNEGQTPETFEQLPEFHWLVKNATRFGFELSYPRGRKKDAYEPWHWRYVDQSLQK